jgi:16S rRNA (uracil1498-N3)-methyltransferase
LTPRLYVDQALAPGAELDLGGRAARHVQVLRLQPGGALVLFDGDGGQWSATILRMTRAGVVVRVGAHAAVERELRRAITLAVGMPANERMDGLIEKATELGVAAIQPLVCERSVLRVAGERAERKAAHWRAIATAACEQCGRNRIPEIGAPTALRQWLLATAGRAGASRWMLSPGAARAWPPPSTDDAPVELLSGPEGGLTAAEQDAALGAGFSACSLGERVLRADTAPLAALAWFALEPAASRSSPPPTRSG